MPRFMGNRMGNSPATPEGTPTAAANAEPAVYSISDQYTMNTDKGWAIPPNPAITASGGITGTYSVGPITKYHAFISDNSFIISELAAGNASQPNGVEVLLVAGGGGGESPATPVSGGGGGGGLLEGTLTFTSAGTYPIVIGGGGPTSSPRDGSPSTFCGCVALGGGGGRATAAGNPGGSGGGGEENDIGGTADQTPDAATASGVTGTLIGYGYAGFGPGGGNVGGGGGGAGGIGGPTAGPYPWSPASDDTSGGPGRENSYLNNTPYYWAGGGAGGVSSGRQGGGGAGGGGGGGNGHPGEGAAASPDPLQGYAAGSNKSGASGGAGGTNTGGGGGGCGWPGGNSAAGGSGICVVRYKTAS